MKELNRLKIVLVEQKRTGKWQGNNFKKNPATISRWCNNHAQPSIDTLDKITEILNIDRRELLNKSK